MRIEDLKTDIYLEMDGDKYQVLKVTKGGNAAESVYVIDLRDVYDEFLEVYLINSDFENINIISKEEFENDFTKNVFADRFDYDFHEVNTLPKDTFAYVYLVAMNENYPLKFMYLENDRVSWKLKSSDNNSLLFFYNKEGATRYLNKKDNNQSTTYHVYRILSHWGKLDWRRLKLIK